MLDSTIVNNFWAGTQVTVQLTLMAAALGTAVAIVSGLAGISPFRVVRWANQVFVDFFRGSSAIIQLFWAFFALPLVGPSFSPMEAGVVVLGLNMGAYGSEIVRGAVRAVPKGQTEAAIAINLSAYQRMRYVIFPQAVVAMLPPYGNLLIELLKGTALVSMITLSDILWEARLMQVNRTASSATLFGIALVIYFVLAQIMVFFVRMAERAASRGMHTTARL